jgi:hypothetical protein
VAAQHKIVLFAHARTGSNLLASLLESLPGIDMRYELFNPKSVAAPGMARRPELVAERDADPLGFLNRLIADSPGPVFAFKWLRGHTQAVREHVIGDPAWRVGILYRENALAVHASGLAAAAAGAYRNAPAAQRPIPFDGKVFRVFVTNYRRFYIELFAELDAAGRGYALIEYQHLQRHALVRNFARHLGIEPSEPMESRDVKTGSADILSRFSNPEDVQATLSDMGLTHWLRDEAGLLGVHAGAGSPAPA